MKVLYAIQGTGNGHLSRAREIIPTLQKHCELDLLVSGTQSELHLPWPVAYKCRGISLFYNRRGGIHYFKSSWNSFSGRVLREVRHIPVENYDLIINDFEPVSAWAARFRKVPCLAMGHQASFLSDKTPRSYKRDHLGETILKRYAPANEAIGFHFLSYDSFIHTPIIRKEIRERDPLKLDYYTVYLPSFTDDVLFKLLHQFPQIKWQVFSRYTSHIYQEENVQFRPVDQNGFTESLADCRGILTGAGFETPAEALYLGKKLFVIPISGQYEQQCNAAALSQMGVAYARRQDKGLFQKIKRWIEKDTAIQVDYPDQTDTILEQLFHKYASVRDKVLC